MPKVSNVYAASSGWIKAKVFIDAGIDQAVFQVEDAVTQQCKDYDGNMHDAIVVTLRGREENKKWELNKTNARTIAAWLGDDTDSWKGHRIGIRLVRNVRFGFGTVDILEAFEPPTQ